MPTAIDREALHRYLWNLRDRAGRLRLNQRSLAEDLGLDRTTVARIMAEFVVSGRLRKLNSGHGAVVLYLVSDPDTWQPVE